MCKLMKKDKKSQVSCQGNNLLSTGNGPSTCFIYELPLNSSFLGFSKILAGESRIKRLIYASLYLKQIGNC